MAWHDAYCTIALLACGMAMILAKCVSWLVFMLVHSIRTEWLGIVCTVLVLDQLALCT